MTFMRQLSSMDRRRDDMMGFSGVIGRTAAGDSSYARQRRQDATIVERLLDRLVKDDLYSTEILSNDERKVEDLKVSAWTYNLAIKAWSNANVRGSAEKAERVLKKLVEAYGGSKIMIQSKVGSNKKISGLSLNSNFASLRPDVFSFAYCYAAWYRESLYTAKNIGDMKASSTASRKADAVLELMKQTLMGPREEDVQSSPSFNVAVDVNYLLEMWSITNQEPDLAERFLRFIESEIRETTKPWINAKSYSIVINGTLTNHFIHLLILR